MKRNFVVSLFGSLIVCGMLLILLGTIGSASARGAAAPRDQAGPDPVSAATPLTATFTYSGQLINGGRAVIGMPPGVPATSGINAPNTALGTAFTYQGQLKLNGSPVNGNCLFSSSLWDAATGGNSSITFGGMITVVNGLFTKQLDFGSAAFQGDARWIEITVNCGTGGVTLAPRQPLTAVPYAFALPGLYTQPNATSPNLIGGYSGNFISPTVVGGTIGGGGRSGYLNRILENFGTVGGGLGNTASNAYASIGGGSVNTASGFVATVGGGTSNTASNSYATVGGGGNNSASGDEGTIGGGGSNTASGRNATVGGGGINTASGSYATIPGGSNNTASGGASFAAGHLANTNNQDGAFVWADSAGDVLSATVANQFLVRALGGVGIIDSGHNLTPTAQLDVQSSNRNVLALKSSNTLGTWANLNNTSAGGIGWSIISTGSANGEGAGKLLLYTGGTSTIMTFATGNQKILMSDGANETSGTWTNNSDRNVKTNFVPVDGRAVLAQVASLPIASWNYKVDDPSIRHIGPMAQDFYAAFNVGNDDKHIGTVDEGGVALAAIQALDQENKDLKAQNADLLARVAKLEQNTPASNPPAQPEPFNVSTLLSVIALIAVGWIGLQQLRSKRGRA